MVEEARLRGIQVREWYDADCGVCVDIVSPAWAAGGYDYFAARAVLSELAEQRYGHDFTLVAVSENSPQAVVRCKHCHVRTLIVTSGEEVLLSGEAAEQPCQTLISLTTSHPSYRGWPRVVAWFARRGS